MEQTLVEFRAGLLQPVENVLRADTRKGLLRVVQADDDLVHVMWYERVGAVPKEQPERDIVVFPSECSLKEVPHQPRCFTLSFAADPSRDEFYWMQEPKADRDAALIAAFNAAVNGELPQPSAPVAPQPEVTSSSRDAADSAQRSGADLAALLRTALASAGEPAQVGSQDSNALAASLMAQMAGKGTKRMRVDEGPGLHDVLQPEAVVPLLQDPESLQALAEHLPEEHRTMKQLIATIQSPQFRQQVALFGAAIQTGQLDTLHQFGLHTKGFSTADFLEAIQEQARKAEGGGPSAME
uniref:Pru domain-containing protein n=1 Tax=Dunaliella tertiolecta TaxID=3047 RepID=A0A7S3VUQ2_DUNTE